MTSQRNTVVLWTCTRSFTEAFFIISDIRILFISVYSLMNFWNLFKVRRQGIWTDWSTCTNRRSSDEEVSGPTRHKNLFIPISLYMFTASASSMHLKLESSNLRFFVDRPYFSRPRKYRWLFSEPTYWPRCSQGQYGEGNNQAGIFEADGNKSFIPGRLVRSSLNCPSTRKVRDEASCLCVASAAMLVQVVCGCPVRNGLIDFFPPAIVSQIAQVDRPKILERMVIDSSPLPSGVFVAFFFSNWGLKKILSILDVK